MNATLTGLLILTLIIGVIVLSITSIALYVRIKIGTDVILIPKNPKTFEEVDEILNNTFGHNIAQYRLTRSMATFDTILFGLCRDNKLPFEFEFISDMVTTSINKLAFTQEFGDQYAEMVQHITTQEDETNNDNFDDIWARG